VGRIRTRQALRPGESGDRCSQYADGDGDEAVLVAAHGEFLPQG
jgi:hypothetical protein